MSRCALCAIYVHLCQCWHAQISCALCTFVHENIQVHAWLNNFVYTVIIYRLNCWPIVHNFKKRSVEAWLCEELEKNSASSRRKNSLEKLIDMQGLPGDTILTLYCFLPSLLCQSFNRKTAAFTAHKEKQVGDAATQSSGHSTVGSIMFSPLCDEHIVCLLLPNDHFAPEAFIKDWHGRNWLSGTGVSEAA